MVSSQFDSVANREREREREGKNKKNKKKSWEQNRHTKGFKE